MNVPFFRIDLGPAEIEAVAAALRSGWLTSGPRAREFEERFATAVGAPHALALSSCTAALHLAVEALSLRPGQGVLVPTMTFAATAEVVRYQRATPILVDCDATTLNLDLVDARRKIAAAENGELPGLSGKGIAVVGMMPVHVGGYLIDPQGLSELADTHGLWSVEDAAHAFPAAWRPQATAAWRFCGEATADVTCFSFYANKTITTGEGGMAATSRPELAERMRVMALHGLSRDAWGRYHGGPWDYKIIAPGFKYNLTDFAAALGLVQLERAEEMRRRREAIAGCYLAGLADERAIELPVPAGERRLHSWHLFPIKLQLEQLSIDRNRFVELLRQRGVGFSVHWRPLHLHPYYQEAFAWRPEDCPTATAVWQRLVSLPIFPSMTQVEQEYVIEAVLSLCREHRR